MPMKEGNLKEIDIRTIIMREFDHKIRNLCIMSYGGIYEALHSPEYRKASKENFPVIYEGFKVAVVELEYLSPKGGMMMRVPFEIHFEFEYAGWRKSRLWNKEYPDGNKFTVKPRLGIDEISIEFPVFLNKKNLDMLNDNIPQVGGGGYHNGTFKYYSICGAHVEGHAMRHSGKKLEERIVSYFTYLFGMIDQACYYADNPDKKPKIIEVEQSSFYEEDLYPDEEFDYPY